MIAAIDNSVLLYLFDPNCAAPSGVPDCNSRVDALITQLSRQGGQLVVPTPVLAELLTRAGPAGQGWLGVLEGKRAIRLASFDALAAVECAAMAAGRKSRNRSGSRDKAKFDEQIVAIARVAGASVIYSDDDDIRKLVGPDIEVIGIADLPLPPSDPQVELPFEALRPSTTPVA